MMSEHRMLHREALRVAAGGVPVESFFERFPGLPALLAERRQYVQEWVRVFYATYSLERIGSTSCSCSTRRCGG